jgi:N-acetylglucosamine-6-phosphate deacetylase
MDFGRCKRNCLPNRMILRNGRCIFPDGIRDGLELVIENGRISEIRNQTDAPDNDVVDLESNYLAPGFIDLHIHGAVGCDTMDGSADAFRAICDYHSSGGTTALLLTTATAPIEQILRVLQAVRDCKSAIRQIAGVHVEGPFICKNKCGAQRAEFIRAPRADSVAQLLEYVDIIKRITIAPELPGALDAIQRFSEHGVSVSGGHSDAGENEAQAAFQRGMRSVTHTFNCMSFSRREGIHRTAGLLEFALSEPEISCELIADGYHASPTLIKMLYRAKAADKICLITDASPGAGLPNQSRFCLAGLECVVKNGVGLLADESALAGGTSRMIDLVRALVHEIDLPLHEAVRMATQAPAHATGLKSKGRLAVGYDADFAIISSQLEIVRTIIGGI